MQPGDRDLAGLSGSDLQAFIRDLLPALDSGNADSMAHETVNVRLPSAVFLCVSSGGAGLTLSRQRAPSWQANGDLEPMGYDEKA